MGTIGPFLWLWKNGGSDSGWGGGGGYDPFSLTGIPVATDVFTPTQFVSGDTPNTYNGYSVSWKLLTQGGWQTAQLGDAFTLFGTSLSDGPSAGPAVLPPGNRFSWWGTFTKSFVSNFGTTTWNSLTRSNGCLNQFFNTAEGDLTPARNPSVSDATRALAEGAPIIAQSLALLYAASQPNYLGGVGLLYPFKSSVVRGILAGGESVAANAPFIAGDVALLHGLVNESASAVEGECQ